MEKNDEEMVAKVALFLRNLCVVPYPTPFVLDKAFTYAIRLQIEEIHREMAMHGVSYEIDELSSEMMEKAVTWMNEAIKSDYRFSHLFKSGGD